MSAEWESITSREGERTSRMKVPGGWLYREMSWQMDDDGNAVAVALCFVPSQAVTVETKAYPVEGLPPEAPNG